MIPNLARLSLTVLGLIFISLTLVSSHFPPKLPETCADAGQIDRQSTKHINSLLRELVTNSTYFSVFRVALDNPCPFWRDEDAKCVIRECTVQGCTEDEVPEAWRDNADVRCTTTDSDDELNSVDRSLTGLAAIIKQPVWYTADEDSWVKRDDEAKSVYVDLRRNPEQYTGYAGPGSQRVWQAIYDENCFIFSDKCRSGICDPDTCKEERMFYRLISGLHASISMHIARRYLFGNSWGPNIEIYKQRLRPYPERIRNLNVAYAVAMRALAKASTSLSPETFEYLTGNEENDNFTKEQLKQMFQLHLLQPHCQHKVFDESDMFLERNKYMLPYFRGAFRNISMIMDCVGCEKCRVWGKLQFLGLGTALRILFEEETPELERNEVIALFNLLYKLSTSVLTIDEMEAQIQQDTQLNKLLGMFVGLCVIGLLSVFSHKASMAQKTPDYKEGSPERSTHSSESSASPEQSESLKVENSSLDKSHEPSEDMRRRRIPATATRSR
ncbi:Endoplasmic Reticulum Oxidoreductin 1 [Gracilaria domingensis]|nr:Endoplasmic Reticulum Oxidoreductin 1 [Gracilaria domingensis]